MTRTARTIAAVLAALTLALVVAAPGRAQEPAQGVDYFGAADGAEAAASKWWSGGKNWYRERLGQPQGATIWGGAVHLFEAEDALAIARPNRFRKNRVRWFARNAERYWNKDFRPSGGYAPRIGVHGARAHAWFDDNGWWGIAFYDAYRATGDRGYLSSANRALMFMDRAGWDPRGGIWWDTAHAYHAGESLATGVLLAASLYQATHQQRYLDLVNKYLGWANAHMAGMGGLYNRHDTDDTPMPYVQGPIFNAYIVLCWSVQDNGPWCDRAQSLAEASLTRFPTLTMGPQYDAMYIRALLELYRYSGNRRWYDVAQREVDRAMANAAQPDGLYLNNWDGRPISVIDNTPWGKLQTHAATTMAIAWMAATKPPQ